MSDVATTKPCCEPGYFSGCTGECGGDPVSSKSMAPEQVVDMVESWKDALKSLSSSDSSSKQTTDTSSSCKSKSKKIVRYRARSIGSKLTVGRVDKSAPAIMGSVARTTGKMLRIAGKRVPVIALINAGYGIYKAAQTYEETGSLLQTGVTFIKEGLLRRGSPESANLSTTDTVHVRASTDNLPAVLNFQFGIGSCEKGDYEEVLTTLREGNFLTDGNDFDYNEWGLFNDSSAVIEECTDNGVCQTLSASVPGKIKMKLRLPVGVGRLEVSFSVSLRDLISKACGNSVGMDQVHNLLLQTGLVEEHLRTLPPCM